MESNFVNPKIVFILNLALPIHGEAVADDFTKDSELIDQTFDCTFINLATASSLANIGKIGLKKIIIILKLCRVIILCLKKETSNFNQLRS